MVKKGDPAILERAKQSTDGRRFLHWARFPYSATVTEEGERSIVVEGK